ELHDRRVELVAACANRRIAHDTRERDDRDLCSTTADVDHHVARRRLDGKSNADGRSHWLCDHEHFLRACAKCRVTHCALLHFGDTRGYTHDHARFHL